MSTQQPAQPKPCPFCGKQPRIIEWCPECDNSAYVRCDSMECQIHPSSRIKNTPAEAIVDWNTRASAPSPGEWRMLKVGEVIQEGDEWIRPFPENWWQKATFSVGKAFKPESGYAVRRRVSPVAREEAKPVAAGGNDDQSTLTVKELLALDAEIHRMLTESRTRVSAMTLEERIEFNKRVAAFWRERGQAAAKNLKQASGNLNLEVLAKETAKLACSRLVLYSNREEAWDVVAEQVLPALQRVNEAAREEITQAFLVLNAELSEARAIKKSMCVDWAEDHTYLQELGKAVGLTEAQTEGDSFGVPGIQDIADSIVAALTLTRTERDSLLKQIAMDTECIERLRRVGMEAEIEGDRLSEQVDGLTKELDAVRICFAEASHNAGPAFVAHEELNRLRAALAEKTKEAEENNEAWHELIDARDEVAKLLGLTGDTTHVQIGLAIEGLQAACATKDEALRKAIDCMADKTQWDEAATKQINDAIAAKGATP